MTLTKEIPNNPGCYLFLDSRKKIIYIGKAKNLKKRVASYFNKKDLDSKTKALVEQIKDVDFIITNNEVEALLLENNLIKKNKPKYNINLKDSRSFSYIELTSEKFPRLISSRAHLTKQKKDKMNLFGPFTSGESRVQILETLNKTFQLRTCKNLPKRKCIRYDIGICSAPCINKISEKEYTQDMKKAEMVLKGKTSELKEKLANSMKQSAKDQDFEKAMKVRNQIAALDYLKEKQTVERRRKYDEDIINFIVKKEKVYLMVFNIYKGTLDNKRTFEFDYKDNFLEEFLTRYYSENKIPKKIILPKKVSEAIEEYLSVKKESKVKMKIPEKGELKDLLKLVEKNIEINFFGEVESLEEIKKRINLQTLPEVIECFDISHLGGTEVVASMVQFRNGKPDKSNYRKFKIRSGDKNDDFKAMNEVVKRRYWRLKVENKPFPDLIVIDGGLGQLNSSIDALEKINVKIPIISLAKREEEIYVPGGKVLQLGEKNKGRLLLQRIRDEAHRFAVKYQRLRRKRSYFK